MNTDLTLLNLVIQASPVVKVILAMLLLASIASWAVIIEKARTLKGSAGAADKFEASFWSGVDLTTLYKDVTKTQKAPLGMAGIFEAGYREFGRLRQDAGLTGGELMEGARRAMQVSQMREMDRLERNLAFLATVGSTSPYVGLFGTVWGIMNTFMGLGGVQSATIAMVAPGIADALIATAAGLFAAIPAVIFYNRYADRVDRLEVRYDTFMEELVAILQRSARRQTAPQRQGAGGAAS